MNEPLTHGEFKQWVQDHFIPQCELDKLHHDKVDRISLDYFGDGNGHAGRSKDIETIMRMAARIDAWLDLMKWIWKAIGSLLAVAVAWFIVAERMGWIK